MRLTNAVFLILLLGSGACWGQGNAAVANSDRATAYYVLAQSYMGQGDKTKARKALINSLDIAPNYEPAQKLLLEITK